MVISDKLSHLPKIKISEVKNLQGDLKTLSDKNYKKLKLRLEKVGFKYPLYLWNNDGVFYNLDGNQRQKTILKAWGDIEVPYVEIEAANEIEAKKEILAISSQYGEVTKEGFYEFSTDFTTEDWGEIDTQTTFEGWKTPEDIEEDDFDVDHIDEVQTDIELGDLIEIGDHRMLCGDSTNILSYEKVCRDELFDLMVTDPPYNVNYEGKTKDKLKIKNDQMEGDEFYKFLLQFFSASFEYTKMGGVWYVWHADSEGANFRKAMQDAGVKVRQCLIWVKNSMVMGRQDYQWKHEPCLYGWKEGARHNWYSDRKQTTVLNFDRPNRNAVHPTMKPLELISYQISNSSKAGDIVGDPFLGSGSTMVASQQLGRKCYGMELDPKYCQVIVDRMLNSFPQLDVKINGKTYKNEKTIRQNPTD